MQRIADLIHCFSRDRFCTHAPAVSVGIATANKHQACTSHARHSCIHGHADAPEAPYQNSTRARTARPVNLDRIRVRIRERRSNVYLYTFLPGHMEKEG